MAMISKLPIDLQQRLLPFSMNGGTAMEELLLDAKHRERHYSPSLLDFVRDVLLPRLEAHNDALHLTDGERSHLFSSLIRLKAVAKQETEEAFNLRMAQLEGVARSVLAVDVDDLFALQDSEGALIHTGQLVYSAAFGLCVIDLPTHDQITMHSIIDGTGVHTINITTTMDASTGAETKTAALTILSSATKIAVWKDCLGKAYNHHLPTATLRDAFGAHDAPFADLAVHVGGETRYTKAIEFMYAKHELTRPDGRAIRQSAAQSRTTLRQMAEVDNGVVDAILTDPRATVGWVNALDDKNTNNLDRRKATDARVRKRAAPTTEDKTCKHCRYVWPAGSITNNRFGDLQRSNRERHPQGSCGPAN